MTKWTAADIPDQTGRVAVITGANTGLGFEIAKALAANNASVVLAVRNLKKGEEAATRIAERNPDASVALQELDLASLRSVRAAADQLRSDHDHIDLLINNAGLGGTPRSTTTDGFELQFGTNHLGHFALTGLLLDQLLATPESRVVTMTSRGHRFGKIRFDDLQSEHHYSRMGAYAQSKLANLLFTYALQRRLTGRRTIATAAHPGEAKTEMSRNASWWMRAIMIPLEPIFQSPDMGALPALRAATAPDVRGGQYFGPDGFAGMRGYPELTSSSERSHDVSVQERLWTVSEKLTGVIYQVD